MEAIKVKTQDLPCGMSLVENHGSETVVIDDGFKARTMRSGDIALCRRNFVVRLWDTVVKGALGVIMAAVAVSGAGCASVATNAYYTRQQAVQLRATNGGATAAVDVMSLGVVAEHPVATLAAACVDAATIIAVNKAGNNNDWWNGFYGIELAGSGDSDGTDSGAIAINGNGNIINYFGQMDHVGAGDNLFNSGE